MILHVSVKEVITKTKKERTLGMSLSQVDTQQKPHIHHMLMIAGYAGRHSVNKPHTGTGVTQSITWTRQSPMLNE